MPINFLTKPIRSIAQLRATDGSPDPTHVCGIGGSCCILAECPADASDYLLVLTVEPSTPHCRLAVSVNGRPQRVLTLHMRSVICCHLSWSLLAGATNIEVTLDTSETVRAGTATGRLAVYDVSLSKFSAPGPSLRPLLGQAHGTSLKELEHPLSDQELLGRFISLGDNCEFGLYQRRHGADGASLLRFATVPIHGLMLALEERFEACYDPREYYFELPKYPSGVREYMLHCERYEFLWHTWVKEDEAGGLDMILREFRKVCMLIRMLFEGLEAGGRILVYKCDPALSTTELARLAQLLATYGRNGLLIVTLARHRRDIGKVEMTESGVMIGYIDRFLPYTAADKRASNAWMTICRNAYACWRASPDLPVGAAS